MKHPHARPLKFFTRLFPAKRCSPALRQPTHPVNIKVTRTLDMRDDVTKAVSEATAGPPSYADSSTEARRFACDAPTMIDTDAKRTSSQIDLNTGSIRSVQVQADGSHLPVHSEFNCIEPIEDTYILNAKLLGWGMPTVVTDNRQVYHAPINEYTDVYLPPDMPGWLGSIVVRDIPRRGSLTLPARPRQLRSTPNSGIINDTPPLRRSAIHDPRSSLDARSSFDSYSSSHTGTVYSSMLNAFGESAYNAASVAWNLEQLTGKRLQSAAQRMYPSSTRVELSYSLHIPTKSILLMLTYTPVKISAPFYGFCGDRIGDFVIWGMYRAFRAFFIFVILQRDRDGVPWVFKDPRLLVVPRAFVEREHVFQEFLEQECRIIDDEWMLVPEGMYADRIDEAVDVGYGTIVR